MRLYSAISIIVGLDCRFLASKWDVDAKFILRTTNFVYNLPQIAVYYCDIGSLKMMPSDEYREALSNATAFKQESLEEKTTAAARIYQVNNSSVRTALLRERERQTKPATSHGGHNKILSDVQVSAIYKYVEDSYFSRYGVTKAMVFAAIGCLKANEVVPKPPPLLRWFQEFMSKHEDLFKTLQTKTYCTSTC
jgi:hypothetical protein